MDYKYKTTIEQYNIPNCPPKDDNLLPCECYHYVFEDIQDKNNFLPHSLRKPENFVMMQDTQKCSWIGLSCWADYYKAVENWSYWNLLKKGKFAKQVGSSLSKLKIDSSDGTNSVKEDNSHFNFYEYKNCNLREKIIGINSIVKIS